MIDINIVRLVLILTITTCYIIQCYTATAWLCFSLKRFDLIVEIVNDVDLRSVDPGLWNWKLASHLVWLCYYKEKSSHSKMTSISSYLGFPSWRKPGVSLNCNYSVGRIINHHLLLFSEMLWLAEIEFSLTIRKLVSRPTLITGEQLAALLWLRRRQPWGEIILVAYVCRL